MKILPNTVGLLFTYEQWFSPFGSWAYTAYMQKHRGYNLGKNKIWLEIILLTDFQEKSNRPL